MKEAVLWPLWRIPCNFCFQKACKDLYYDATTKKWTKKEDTLTSKPGAKDEYDEQIIAGIYVA